MWRKCEHLNKKYALFFIVFFLLYFVPSLLINSLFNSNIALRCLRYAQYQSFMYALLVLHILCFACLCVYEWVICSLKK